MPLRRVSERHEDKPAVCTGNRVFSNGSILELVRIPSGELNLLFWDGKSAKTAGQFVTNNETLVPLRVDPTIVRSMHLPSGVADYGSTRKLFTEISSLISRVTGMGDSVAQPLTFFVLATWMVDRLPIAPFVWIVAPPTIAAAPVARLLGLLCRRALTVNDVGSRGLLSLTLDLQPTLLTETFRPTRRVLDSLRASSRHCSVITTRGGAVDPFCAKAVFAPEPLHDPASAGFPLEVVLPPTLEYIQPLNQSQADNIAAEFQPKLLQYRLLNLGKVHPPTFDLAQFTSPVQQLADTLGSSVVDDDELQSQLVRYLKPQDFEIRAARASLLTAIVLEVLLARCHSATTKSLSVGDMTADTNTILRGRGEPLEVSPETVGWILRNVGLRTHFIFAGRKGLSLINGVGERIHQLAYAHEVRSLRGLSLETGCPLCAALIRPKPTKAHAAGTS